MSAPSAVPSVTVIDYGAGNLHSVQNALGHLGAQVRFATEGDAIMGADRLLLPGVGAFADGMAELRSRGFVDAVRAFAATGRPLMGICLGMQFLFEKSEEFGTHDGLSLLGGVVKKLPTAPGIKVPHVGWNRIRPRTERTEAEHGPAFPGGMLAGVSPGAAMYFVHSYAALPTRQDAVLAVADYGDAEVTAAVAQDNIMGCQFHPEKSGPVGLSIIENFLRMLPNAGIYRLEVECPALCRNQSAIRCILRDALSLDERLRPSYTVASLLWLPYPRHTRHP